MSEEQLRTINDSLVRLFARATVVASGPDERGNLEFIVQPPAGAPVTRLKFTLAVAEDTNLLEGLLNRFVELGYADNVGVKESRWMFTNVGIAAKQVENW